MHRNIYSVFDSKAKAFLQPFFTTNHAVASRQFAAAVQQEGHEFNRFAEDYSLFHLGSYDEATGKVEQPATPEPIITAMALKGIDNG